MDHVEAVLLTPGDVARLAGQVPDTVRAAIRAGRLAATRTVGGIRLVRRADALEYAARVRERRTTGPEAA